MGTPNSVQLLQDAEDFNFDNVYQEIGSLGDAVRAEEVKLLDATLTSLRPQLKYVTDPPAADDPIHSPHAEIIPLDENEDGLYILRSGKWFSVPTPWHQELMRKGHRVIGTEEAISVHGLEKILEGLGMLFLGNMMDLEYRKNQLQSRIAKLQASQAALK
jgi:hypothetical protein